MKHPTKPNGEPWPSAPVFCGRVARSHFVEVNRAYDVEDGYSDAYASGLQTCGSVWACPVCSASIRDGRTRQLVAVIGEHLAQGGGLLLATLTMPHRFGDDLSALLDTLTVGWQRAMLSGRPAKRQQAALGWLGAVRAVEITYGRSGFHPHLHVLVFTDAPVSDDARNAYESWLSCRWAAQVRKLAGTTVSPFHGVRVEPVRSSDDVGRYLSKVQDDNGETADRDVALELLRGDLKQARRNSGKGLVPFQLLDLIGDDDERVHLAALRVWHEYEWATRGRRALTGLSPLLDLYGVDDASDVELAEAGEHPDLPDHPDLIVRTRRLIPAATWLALCRAGMDAEYLDSVEANGFDGAEQVLRRAQAWCEFHPPDPAWV